MEITEYHADNYGIVKVVNLIFNGERKAKFELIMTNFLIVKHGFQVFMKVFT